MNFKDATDALFESVTHAELADELRMSVASIRQARLSADAKARRSPPERWQGAVLKLAEARVRRLQRLVDRLKAMS